MNPLPEETRHPLCHNAAEKVERRGGLALERKVSPMVSDVDLLQPLR
jgi:hypothetical protein